jgi:hypothetical protein
MKICLIVGLAVLRLSVLTANASAGTVVAKFNSVSPSKTFDYSLDGGSTWKSTLAGMMNWTRLGGTEADNPAGDFFTFCVEMTQHVNYNGQYTYNVVDLEDAPSPGGLGVGNGMGLTKANSLRELWGEYIDNVVDANTASAFQIAVWEIVYDDALALNAGSFLARFPTQSHVSLAQTWLNTLDGRGPMPVLMGISHASAQDQVYFESPAVPLPSAAWTGAALMTFLIGRRVRQVGAQ